MRSCEYREVNQEVSFQKYRWVLLTTEQNHVASIGWILYDALSFLCIHKKDNASEALKELLLKSSDGHFSFHYSFAFKFFLNSRLLDPDNLEPVQSKVPLTDSSKKAITCFVSVNCSKGRSMFSQSQGALTVAVPLYSVHPTNFLRIARFTKIARFTRKNCHILERHPCLQTVISLLLSERQVDWIMFHLVFLSLSQGLQGQNDFTKPLLFSYHLCYYFIRVDKGCSRVFLYLTFIKLSCFFHFQTGWLHAGGAWDVTQVFSVSIIVNKFH